MSISQRNRPDFSPFCKDRPYSAAALLGFSALTEQGQWAATLTAGWPFVAAVLYSAIVISVIAHTAYYGLIQKYEATLISPLVLMTPLFTIVLGVLVTHDHFDARMAIGATLALADAKPVPMTLTLIDAPSPNFDARTKVPDMIVLHYTGMQTGEAALARLCDPEARVSSHYLVEEDGRVFRLVAEERRAWHAGVSFWKGEEGVNHASIGIEIAKTGREEAAGAGRGISMRPRDRFIDHCVIMAVKRRLQEDIGARVDEEGGTRPTPGGGDAPRLEIDRVEAATADPRRRCPAAAVINLSQCQKP
eukprot:gene35893-48275_t